MDGRVAVITGGAGHLGRAMGAALAEVGASVVVVDLDAAACAAVAADLARDWGARALGVAVDLRDENATRALPDRVIAEFGRLDVLVNNAAFVGTTALPGWAVPFPEQSSETWRKALEVNVTAAFNLVQACEGPLRRSKHGVIINVASIYGLLGPDLRLYAGMHMGNPAAYAASKGALLQFTRWCATALAPEIRSNAITPGGLFRNQDPVFVERYTQRTPLGRMGTEEDFLGAVVYLASDLSSYMTGQNLVIDGGWSAW